jgi:chorismate dehydratase
MATQRIRVGIVDYLNSWPLAWSFLRNEAPDRYLASFHPPARVAALLAAGELDVGLIPSIELQRIEGLSVIPGLCVAARREVRSVLLISSKPPSEIRRLALDRNSRTSAALVQILLRDRYGVSPECVEAAPEIEQMLAGADAALVIGDPALHIERGRYLIFDLAREWRELTGYPFVFAVWAVRRELASQPDLARELSRVFASSLDSGLASMDVMTRRAAEQLGLELTDVVEYLTENLSFSLAEDERAALDEYFRRALVAGLIDQTGPLRFLPA